MYVDAREKRTGRHKLIRSSQIKDRQTLERFGRASDRCKWLVMRWLHKRLAVSGGKSGSLSKVIQTLEPYLTIAQKKQLRSERRVKGQQERYNERINEDWEPLCASCVRQLVMGPAKPGTKIGITLQRYFEEAVKHMKDLEIVETGILTE